MASAMSFAMECMSLWRDRVVSPWRYNHIFYSDSELDSILDRIFRRVSRC